LDAGARGSLDNTAAAVLPDPRADMGQLPIAIAMRITTAQQDQLGPKANPDKQAMAE